MIKQLTSTSIAALATLFIASAPANATDIFGGSAKDNPGYAGPVAVSWSGLYIGGSIGYGNANHDLSVRDFYEDFCLHEKQLDNVDLNLFEDTWGDHGPLRSKTLAHLNIDETPGEKDFYQSCEQRIKKEANDDNPVELEETNFVTTPGASREVASLDGMNTTGIVGDVRLGYDQQMGRWLFGIFGSYGLSGMEGDAVNSPFAGFGDFNLERGDDWSVGVRAGKLLSERTLLYILAAYTQTEYELSGTFNGDAFSQDTTFDGVTVGGGLEHALTHNVFLGIEGTHSFYGGEDIFNHYDPKTNVGTIVHDDLGETKIMGTLKIKLNSGLFN